MTASPLTSAGAERPRPDERPRLVVGVDGSEGAKQALRWARREAGALGAEVLAALAFGPLGRPWELDALETRDLDELSSAAQALLDDAVAEVPPPRTGETGPTGDPAVSPPSSPAVSPLTVYDEPVDGLLQLTRPTDMLVLGSRGWGRFRRLLLGSVATECLQQHPGTVVVVRGDVPGADERPVLVGVDGSADSLAALRWAAAHAVRHGASLRIVRAWSLPTSLHPTLRSLTDRNRELGHARSELRTMVRTALAEMGGLHGLSYSIEVVEDSPTSALTAAAGAQLLVVGRGGPTALRHRPLGSTALSCALNADTSVAVVATAAPAAGPEDTATPEELS